ncbi:MAG: hypothetical protein M3R24_41045 [Chloroflexota bacterium]|nr:hypothetical protein [Chloroflexota bacterium]
MTRGVVQRASVSAGTNAFTQNYTYDDNNNRLTITKNGTTTSATYDAANQMTCSGYLLHLGVFEASDDHPTSS